MSAQLALPLKLQDHAVFESFHRAGNAALYAYLYDLSEAREGAGCFVWGASATGKTHLLQAVCERAGDQSAYLPLAHLAGAGADVLQGLASRQFVCLDDIQLVTGKQDWEVALFALYNQIADQGSILIVSSNAPPRESGIDLADLKSRISRLPVFQTRQLAENDRIQALQLRARHRGLELPDDTATYMLTRSKRDMGSLYQLLDRLDTEALIAKKRLTIPFVRDVISRS